MSALAEIRAYMSDRELLEQLGLLDAAADSAAALRRPRVLALTA